MCCGLLVAACVWVWCVGSAVQGACLWLVVTMLLCCGSCVWWLCCLCECVALRCCFVSGGFYLLCWVYLVAGFSGCFGALITCGASGLVWLLVLFVSFLWFLLLWWFVLH